MQEPPEWVWRASQKCPTHLRSAASFENIFSLPFFPRKVYRKTRSKKSICSTMCAPIPLLTSLRCRNSTLLNTLRVCVRRKSASSTFSQNHFLQKDDFRFMHNLNRSGSSREGRSRSQICLEDEVSCSCPYLVITR